MVKAALLGKIKDAACIDIGEQLFQRTSQKQRTVTRITELFASTLTSPSHAGRVTAGDRTTIIDDIVRFCAKDIKPFSVVEGAGFLEQASGLISLGASMETFL